MYTVLKPYYTHYKSLTQLGLPIIIGQIGTIILGLADTLMIGQHSTTELGAAAFVNNMFVLVIHFTSAMPIPMSTAMPSTCNQKVLNVLCTNFCISLLIFLIVLNS